VANLHMFYTKALETLRYCMELMASILCRCLIIIIIIILCGYSGGAAVQCQTHDRKVAGLTPGWGAINSTRSTQPSITPGVGKSSTSLYGWG